jgi:hypothetical protein
MITREHYDIAIARLNELDDRIPYRPSDRIAMSRWIKDEVEYWEQVIWDYETQQERANREREVPPNS